MTQEPTIKNVLEAVHGLSSHMDEELADARSEMHRELGSVRQEIGQVREEMGQMKSDLITEIDRFVVLHQTLDIEIVSLRSRCQRMESFMCKVAQRLELEFEPT